VLVLDLVELQHLKTSSILLRTNLFRGFNGQL
jgi:hypothetical protein